MVLRIAIPFLFDHLEGYKNAGYQTGDGKTQILYKINSITDRYSAITHYVGKQLEAEKAARGASDGFRGNRFTGSVVKRQNDALLETGDTAERIAKSIHENA